MVLVFFDFLNGFLSLAFVSITVILGAKIVSRYFEFKDKNYILVGFALIFFASGWYGSSFSFIISLLFEGAALPIEIWLALNFIPLSIGIFLWVVAYSNFVYEEKRYLLQVPVGVYLLIMDVYMIYYIIVDPSIIMSKISAVDTQGTNFFLGISLGLIIILFLITGIIFSKAALKSDNEETRLKGKILMVTFPSFSVAAFLDALTQLTTLSVIIYRIILIFSAIGFYAGFMLPKWVQKLLLKE